MKFCLRLKPVKLVQIKLNEKQLLEYVWLNVMPCWLKTRTVGIYAMKERSKQN
jgi:hypothetical protein